MPQSRFITSARASLYMVLAAPGWDCINARQRKYAQKSRLWSAHPVSRLHPGIECRESAGLFARGLAVHWRDGLAAGPSRIRTLGPTTQSTPRGCEGPYYPECIKLSHRVRPVHLDFSQNSALLTSCQYASRMTASGSPGTPAGMPRHPLGGRGPHLTRPQRCVRPVPSLAPSAQRAKAIPPSTPGPTEVSLCAPRSVQGGKGCREAPSGS